MTAIFDSWLAGGERARRENLDDDKRARQQRLDQQKQKMDQQLFEERKRASQGKRMFKGVSLLNQYVNTGNDKGIRRVISSWGDISPEMKKNSDLMLEQYEAGGADAIRQGVGSLYNQGIELGVINKPKGLDDEVVWNKYVGMKEGDLKEDYGRFHGIISKNRSMEDQSELIKLRSTEAGLLNHKRIRQKDTSEKRKEKQENVKFAISSSSHARDALNVMDRAASGLYASGKVALAKLFPMIDVKDEGLLNSAFTQLALDQLQKFKGPTTDFEYKVAQSVSGVFSDPREANRAKLNAVLRAAWFAKEDKKQFGKRLSEGNHPLDYEFDYEKTLKTRGGAYSLLELRNVAAKNHITIDEARSNPGKYGLTQGGRQQQSSGPAPQAGGVGLSPDLQAELDELERQEAAGVFQ